MWKKCRLVFQTVIIFVESTIHRSSGSWQSACNELHKALTVWIHHLLPTKQATIQYRLYESLWDSHQGSSQENKWHLDPAVKKTKKTKTKTNSSKDLASTGRPLWANLGTHTLKHETCGKRVSRYPFSLSHNPSLGRIVWQAKGTYAWETSEWNKTPLPHFDNVVIHFITTVWQDGLPYVIAGENKEQLLHITRTLFSF